MLIVADLILLGGLFALPVIPYIRNKIRNR